VIVIHDTMNGAGAVSGVECWASLVNPLGYRIYDDFVSTTSGTIRTVSWQGTYCPSPPIATQFVLTFVPDSGSANLHPDVETGRTPPLYSETFSKAQVNEKLDATGSCSSTPQQQCAVYSYSATLTTPFTVAAGVRYWLMVQADVPAQSGTWGWRRGTADNGRAFSSLGGELFLLFDLAFSLK
jgi:hypothetical protein